MSGRGGGTNERGGRGVNGRTTGNWELAARVEQREERTGTEPAHLIDRQSQDLRPIPSPQPQPRSLHLVILVPTPRASPPPLRSLHSVSSPSAFYPGGRWAFEPGEDSSSSGVWVQGASVKKDGFGREERGRKEGRKEEGEVGKVDSFRERAPGGGRETRWGGRDGRRRPSRGW